MRAKTKSLRNRILIPGIFFILIAGLSIGGYIFRKSNITQKEDVNSYILITPNPSNPFRTVRSEATSLKLPPLPPNFNWQMTTDMTQFPKEMITEENNTTNKSVNAALSGVLWKHVINGIGTNDQLDTDGSWNEIIQYYQKETEKLGWGEKVIAGNNTISAVNADGDGASMMGFVGAREGKIRGVSLVSQTKFSSGEFPIDAACPCDQTFYIFESDETPLSEILD